MEALKNLSNGRILLTDDEPFCLDSLKMIIAKSGFDTSTLLDVCISGTEMVEVIKRSWENGIEYKLILTDFSMPEMDGVEATMLVRQFLNSVGLARKHQPIIIGVTGHDDENFTKIGLKAGMD